MDCQLLVALVLLFATDIGDACLLVFINVEDSFSWHRGPLDVVRWQSGVDFLLLRRLRRARAETRSAEQGCCVRLLQLGTTGHEKRGSSCDEDEDDV